MTVLCVRAFATLSWLCATCSTHISGDACIRNHQQIAANRRFIVDYNVLFHFIQIVRLPLLGEIPPAQSYLIVMGVTLLGYVAATLVYRGMRRQLAFFA